VGWMAHCKANLSADSLESFHGQHVNGTDFWKSADLPWSEFLQLKIGWCCTADLVMFSFRIKFIALQF
jgi:hypothetical protein